VLRLFTTGMLLGFVVILATFRPVSQGPVVVRCESAAPVVAREHAPRVNVVDVAAGVTPAMLARILRLEDSERIAAINDRALGEDDGDATVALAELAPRAGQLLDLAIAGPRGERRALVVIH